MLPKHSSPATSRAAAATPSLSFQVCPRPAGAGLTPSPLRSGSSFSPPRKRSAFTLIELLVVIAIIAILAGLGFAGVNGALKQGRKTEVRAMANQIKLAIESYYAEYGYYPSATASDATLLGILSGTDAVNNKRAIRFMELPAKFTNSSGIVTPPRFYASGQSNFQIRIDTNFSGSINAPDGSSIRQSVAVGIRDPDIANNWIGTWK
jgi:prepilin-type N-terminal cleavage/methylation domain-containing protein